MAEEIIDVTEERDVTEQVEQFDASQHGLVLPEPEPFYQNDDDIVFVSMDTKSYLISRKAINWDDMLTAESSLLENQFAVRQILKEIMFGGNNSANAAIRTAFENVRPFLVEFGFDPTEGYHAMYPNGSDYDYAIMYCIDANEVLHTVLREIAIHKAKINEEENTNEG